MNKPIILAICGKSSSGKTTLAKELSIEFNKMNIDHTLVISDTTRSPRIHEQQDVAYHFVSKRYFEKELAHNNYIEHTKFRGWYYGVHKSELTNQNINILVVNPDGLRTLQRYRRDYLIIPIYIQDRFLDRLQRSIEREGMWRFEYFRRAAADWIDFLGIEKTLDSFPTCITLKNENGAFRKVKRTLLMLQVHRII